MWRKLVMVVSGCTKAVLLAGMLALFGSFPAAAQTSTGSVRGTVTDPTGAPIAGATITARNTQTGFQRQTQTQQNGFYNLGGLNPGDYQITLASSFNAAQSRTISVGVGQNLVLDLRATPQAVALEGLTVTAVAPSRETRTSEVATNVTPQQIENLPQGNRNFLNFAALAPGVQLSTDEQRKTFSSGGLPSEQVNVFIDGASFKNDILQGGIAGQDASRGNPFPQNAIQEFRVITENYKAEYQNAASAIITATTKSGGNTFEGNAFVYGQPNAFVEQDFFANQRCDQAKEAGDPCAPKPDYRRYQVGASMGGPIIRDKLHFFGSYEGNYQDRSNTVSVGNTELAPAGFQDFAGNFGSPFRSNLFFGKFSYQPSPTQNLELSGNFRHESEIRDFGGQTSFQSATDLKNDVNTIILKHDYSRGSWLNQANVSYQFYQFNPVPTNPDLIGQNYFGILRVGGNSTEQNFTQKRLALRNDVSYSGLQLAGDHVIKGGVTLNFLKYDVQKFLNGNPVFNYRSDISLDFPFEAQYGVGNPDLSTSNRQLGAYLQDDWSLTSKLLLNLGIRWDYETDMLNNDYVTPQSVRSALGGLLPSSYFTDGTDRPPFYGAFQPRFGASYDLFDNGRTVLFGGFGVYYDRQFYNAILDEKYRLQYGVRTFRFSADGEPRDGQPTIVFKPEYLSKAGLDQLIESGAAPNPEVFLLNNDTRPPKTNQWSLGVRQTISSWLVSATYTGVRGYNLLTYIRANRNVNPDDPNALPPTGACCQNIGNFSNAFVSSDQKRTWYNALLVKADKPYTADSKWGVTLAYTLAKAEQIGGDLFSLDKPRVTDYPRIPSIGDQRQTIVASGMVGLPYQFRLSTLMNFGSGRAYQVIDARQGFGPNEITFYSAYPNGGFATRQVDLRLDKSVLLPGRNRVGVVAELFNVFNYETFGGFQNFIPPEGNPDLGKPSFTVGNPRRFQLGVTYDFGAGR